MFLYSCYKRFLELLEGIEQLSNQYSLGISVRYLNEVGSILRVCEWDNFNEQEPDSCYIYTYGSVEFLKHEENEDYKNTVNYENGVNVIGFYKLKGNGKRCIVRLHYTKKVGDNLSSYNEYYYSDGKTWYRVMG